jgi:hypothetical protein
VHGCFLGAAVALPSVAGNAAGHDVVPALVAAPGYGNDVVERELSGGKAVAAVLAAVVVAGVHVRPRERHIREGSFHPDVTEQAKHRRELHPDRDAADLPLVDGNDLDLPLEEERHGLLPGHDPQGLVGCVKN